MNTLNADVLMAAKYLFDSNGWPTTELSDETDESVSTMLFESFCTWLRYYEKKEQDLLVELTRRFLYIQAGDYTKEIKKLFRKIQMEGSSTLESARRILFCSLKKRSDKGVVKSTDFLFYILKAEIHKLRLPIIAGKQLIFCNEHIDITFNPLYDRVICFDDFIGSGTQVDTAIKEFLEDYPFPLSSITILALVAHCKGIKYLCDARIDHYVGIIVNRGISDNYTGDTLYNNLATMSAIESKLKITENHAFHFGYKACEALVAMARTPNDTFPVYWRKCKHQPVCPFPR